MKMKEFGPPGGGTCVLALPLGSANVRCHDFSALADKSPRETVG